MPSQHQCDNGSWVGPDAEMRSTLASGIPDLDQRIEPGGTVPSGECPHCGALCYPVAHNALHLAATDAALSEPDDLDWDNDAMA
jgi:hypothetical protein